MCLITLIKPDVAPLSNNKMRQSLRSNDDGTGVMFPNGDGKLTVIKTMGDAKEQLELYKKYKNEPLLAVHNRYTTHGKTDEDNCHPFEVLNKEEHGFDLYMMHNGTINKAPTTDEGMSDTWHFVECIVKPVLIRDPKPLGDEECVLNDPKFQAFIEKFIDSSKLLFMDGYGDTLIINEDLGEWTDEGIWLSSPHYVRGSASRFQSSSRWSGYGGNGQSYSKRYNSNSRQDNRQSSYNFPDDYDDWTDDDWENYTNSCGYGGVGSGFKGGQTSSVVEITNTEDDANETSSASDATGDTIQGTDSHDETDIASAYAEAYGKVMSACDDEGCEDADEGVSSGSDKQPEGVSTKDVTEEGDANGGSNQDTPFRRDPYGLFSSGKDEAANTNEFIDDADDYWDIQVEQIMMCIRDASRPVDIEELFYDEDTEAVSEAMYRIANGI